MRQQEQRLLQPVLNHGLANGGLLGQRPQHVDRNVLCLEKHVVTVSDQGKGDTKEPRLLTLNSVGLGTRTISSSTLTPSCMVKEGHRA